MPGRLWNLSSRLLDLVPTVLALVVLGAVAWWGYRMLAEKSEETTQSKEGKTEAESTNWDASANNLNAYVTLLLQNQPLNAVGCSSYFLVVLKTFKLESEDTLNTSGIQMDSVKERLIGEYVEAHGDIDFDQNRYAHLSTRAKGTAWSVHKHNGDKVRKGEVLALIASPEVAQLKFDLQSTLLTVQTRRRYFQRLQESGNATARQETDRAEAALREARINLSKDQQSLQNLGLTISADELAQMSDEQAALYLRTLGIPASLLQDLDANSLTSNLLPMYAPFDSVVIKRDIVIGEVVNPGTPQFVLADVSRLWIMLHVHQEDIGKLRHGQEVFFRVDATKEEAPPAKITWISDEVDEKTRTVLVRADVANPKGRLRPNAFGDGRILVRQEKRAIVPNAALQFDGVSYLVFARGESATEFQPLRVTLGPRHQDFTVVLSGLQAGQTLAVAGTHVLLSEMLKERIGGED